MGDKKYTSNSLKEKQRFYKTRLIWYRIKHGMIYMSLFNLLRRTGVVIFPYWIELEGKERCSEPRIKDSPDLYSISPLNNEEIERCFQLLNWNISDLKERLQSEYFGVGLYREGELAAITMARLDSFLYKGREFKLESNEAYMENMYTFEKFRGKNLAAFLRYRSYEVLEQNGKTVCYSITNYFNRSSLKFKGKLNAQHLELRLYLSLFNRFQWNFPIKKNFARNINN